MMYSREERMFILSHYFAPKSPDAVGEAFSSAYPDKHTPSETVMMRLVTKWGDTGSVWDTIHVASDTDDG